MASWLTDVDEARKKPVRTITTSVIVVFTSLALGDYYIAGTHSASSALSVGGACAAAIVLVLCRGLWPNVFDRPVTSRGASRFGHVVWRWHFVIGCFLIALALVVVGASVGSTGVAATGIPFLAIAAVLVLAKKWIRTNRR